jgi:hypothetical protein
MAYDRFMIAPWLIPDDAFANLFNMYIFRGRLRKRFGGLLMGVGAPSSLVAPLYSRAAISLGNSDGAGHIVGVAPGAIFAIGQQFSCGNIVFTVTSLGSPTTLKRTDGSVAIAQFDTATGAFVLQGLPLVTETFFYPATPIMGLTIYEKGDINNQPSFAFDTQFAYTFAGGNRWLRSGSGTTPIWHGNDIQFFWTSNWQGIKDNVVVMFVTNFNATVGAPGGGDDPLWYYDGTTWTAFTPRFMPAGGAPTTGPKIQTARIIVAFKNRLLLLNTIEQNAAGNLNESYVNRCRFSHNGSPLASNAWYEPGQSDNTGLPTGIGDGGDYMDATTEEQIVSAEFIKDRLIIYFERSTWEIAYTGNEVKPFIWQKINTELGSEATFSSVPFDKVILTIGNTGVHACNGANVERIDNKIPDQIFQIKNKDEGVKRVAGIRDYFTEMVYWTFPSSNQNPLDSTSSTETFPNRVLVYNYKNGSWAFNDDCITSFGYFEQQQSMTWSSSAPLTWEQANFQWSSGVIQSAFRQIIAGNQQGFIFVVAPDVSRNAQVMQITNISAAVPNISLVIVDHTLTENEWIIIENAVGVTGLNGNIYQVQTIVDSNTITVGPASFSGTYLGGGMVSRVSNIGILSKQWNPYVDQGRDVYVAKIDFAVKKTTDGQVTVDYFPSSTELSMITEAIDSGSILGTSVLETSPYPLIPLENSQDRLWHPVYFQTEGQCIQIFISLSSSQISDPSIAFEDFQLEAMTLYTTPTTSRMQ